MTVTSAYAGATPAANTQTAPATAAGGAAGAVASSNTLTKLAGNFNDFLSLLTTQLKNQDPTAPMDTNQFTSQLVQFTAVAEQISTNATLGQLLTSSVAQQLGQASGLVGKHVTFSGGALPLQHGAAQVDFQSNGAQPVQVSVTDAAGRVVQAQTVNAGAGTNTWSWDGSNAAGRQLPDGAYGVAVTAGGAALPFQAVGTVTGAEQVNQAVQLQFGATNVAFANIVALTAAAAPAASTGAASTGAAN